MPTSRIEQRAKIKRGKASLHQCGATPVDAARRAGPCGVGDWPGFDVVYRRIATGCEIMGRNKSTHLSAEHVQAMADLGSGHEERMKARVQWFLERGYKIL